MDRNTFGRLCCLLSEVGGLRPGKVLGVAEQVAIFVGVLAHHKKNRVVGFDFWRSGATVSRYMHKVLGAVLNLHSVLLAKPTPVPDNCDDPRWKWFKGCLGALDGTHINVLFVYVLPGWEGSAGDSRVLRDAVFREGGLKVPKGFYYLCDNGYANTNGFLTPFKGVRYHLKEWGSVEADLEEACFPYTTDEESVASDYVESVEPSAEWSQFRDDIALEMWNSR
ncbi:hypothetical protein AAHA92_25356 [Salvia divinorum]|uniref:DUF8040 domain-containing protein n=1 Tax=Salvia divinorum TaxID=28513 RepID=A0ABD1GAD1_SALDI